MPCVERSANVSDVERVLLVSRHTVHAANETSVCWSFTERDGVGQNQDGARKYACGAESSDRTANDEGSGVGCGTTDSAADLKDKNGYQVNPFEGEKGVEFAEEELEGAGTKEVGAVDVQ